MKFIRLIFRYFYPKLKYLILFVPYRIRGNNISFTAVISKGTLMNYCNVNHYSYIGHYCSLNSCTIGKYSSIAPYVMIGGAEHSYWWYSTSHHISKENIGGKLTVVGNDVWIGTHAVIRQGITIGNGAVIGAGSVVLSDVEPYSVVVGSPAKKIKMRFDSKTEMAIEGSDYWNYSPNKAFTILTNLFK
nr:CatB-related O-acetyltransferase [uncultured Flavobacterium sp.]